MSEIGTKPVERLNGRPRFWRRPTDARRIEPSARPIPEAGATPGARRRDRTYRRTLAVADALSATAAVVVSVPLIGADTLSPLGLLAIPLVLVVGKVAGLYDRDEHVLRKTTLDEAPELFRVATLYTLLVFLAGDLLVQGHFGRDQAVGLWLLLFASMVVTRAVGRRAARAIAGAERCLVLGGAESARWLAAKLEAGHGLKAVVVGRVPLEADPPATQALPVLGRFDRLAVTIAAHDIDRVIIAPRTSDAEHIIHAIRLVKALGVKVSVLPRLFEVVGSAVEFDDVDGAILLGVRGYGLTRSSRALKRALDLAGAGVGAVMMAPLFAVVAVAIKLESPGPVLFRQPRVGRLDREFQMLKFRTMVDGADREKHALSSRNEAAGGLFKIADDPRVTRVGRLLRRTALDELPQLLNVLRGDMSLVGPRPLVPDEDRWIRGWERRRLLLTPGMTGLWQVFGSARIPLDEMVKIDYLYGATWSPWLDVKILVRTLGFVVARRGL